MSVPIYSVSFRQWAFETHSVDVNELIKTDERWMTLLREYVDAMCADDE